MGTVRRTMSPTLHSILVFVFLSSSAQLLEGCNDGYAEFEGACYGLMQGLGGVEEYKLECEVLGGDLVSIHSAEENDFVLSLLAPPDKSKEGYTAWTWTSGMCPGMKCEWIDGTAWTLTCSKMVSQMLVVMLLLMLRAGQMLASTAGETLTPSVRSFHKQSFN